MKILKKVIKIGESLGIVLDKTIINGRNIKVGTKFEMDINFKNKKINLKEK